MSDIFSLGMVFFEIVSGEIPFKEERSEVGVIEIIKEGDRPYLPDSCHQGLKTIIEMCWEQAPEKRPTAQQVVEMLSNLVKNPLI